MEILILVLIAVPFILYYLNVSQKKNAEQPKQVALESINRVPSLLRERTGMGPWYELEWAYQTLVVDIKCTSCEIDRIWACKFEGETYFADFHYAKGQTRITLGDRCLFNGDALGLLRYPISDQVLRLNNEMESPPEGTWASSGYNEWKKPKASSNS